MTFIKHAVERDEWVGKASHPYKIHPVIKAGGVPSLLLIQGNNVLIRCDDDEHFANEDLMQEFVEAGQNLEH